MLAYSHSTSLIGGLVVIIMLFTVSFRRRIMEKRHAQAEICDIVDAGWMDEVNVRQELARKGIGIPSQEFDLYTIELKERGMLDTREVSRKIPGGTITVREFRAPIRPR